MAKAKATKPARPDGWPEDEEAFLEAAGWSYHEPDPGSARCWVAPGAGGKETLVEVGKRRIRDNLYEPIHQTLAPVLAWRHTTQEAVQSQLEASKKKE